MTNAMWVSVVDADGRAVVGARVRAATANGDDLALHAIEGRWQADAEGGDRVTLEAEAAGFAREAHAVTLRDAVTQVIIGLRRPGEIGYSKGDSRLALKRDDTCYLLKVRGRDAAQRFADVAKRLRLAWRPASMRAPGNDLVFAQVTGDVGEGAHLAEEMRRDGVDVAVLRIIRHGDGPVFGLGNELVVRFADDVTRADAERLAQHAGMEIAREVRHAGNAYVLTRMGPPTYDVLAAADALAQSGRTRYAEPNLTFVAEPDQYVPNDPLWPDVPHLPLINAGAAWERLGNVAADRRGGTPAITIAVIDDEGVAPDHPELLAALTDGTAKLDASMNFAVSPIVAQAVAGLGGDHGTQCAASATAAFDDHRGLPGVAPNCHLLGAQIDPLPSDVLMADVYLWVAGFLNGSTAAGFPTAPPLHAADVISSSWGVSQVPLSNTLRDCFDFLTTFGRGGKGCVLCFSIGNNGYLDFSLPGPRYRAWAAYEKVLGIGASVGPNPTSPVQQSVHADPAANTSGITAVTDTRALYSPYGSYAATAPNAWRKPDLVAPSSTAYVNGPLGSGPLDPVMSAVRVGNGTRNGCVAPAVCDDYARTFSGTSQSTPLVAGAVALVLSARPDLNWVQVREILRRSCARVDNTPATGANANAIGQWRDADGDGQVDYSRWYGAGRIDVDAAVAMALDPALGLADIYVRDNLGDVGDVASTGAWSESPDIWVRQDASEAIPNLSWGDPPPHQNALRGQDNAIFCRVRNRGSVAAPVVYVRAMIAHWGGLEFAYPQDFRASTPVGGTLPSPLARGSYLIGEARIDDLAPGADRIVKLAWPQALIPPPTFSIGTAQVLWHPCLLLEASPHDGPAPIGGLAVPVQGDNNIAQRNIRIVDPGAAESESFVGMMAGSDGEGGVTGVRIDASAMRDLARVRLHVADAELMRRLRAGMLDARPAPRAAARQVLHDGLDSIEFELPHGTLELALALSRGRFVPLLVSTSGGSGDLAITQRRGDGRLSAGYVIRRQRTRD
ncbi:MAG: S8 family serine peptidase [Betaproteobacteria bacterium]